MTRYFFLMVFGLFSLPFSTSLAATYQIPGDGSKVIGEMSVVTAKRGDTLNRIAVRNGVGYNEILRANPKLKRRKLRSGTPVIIPSAYVLPEVEHHGIVINLSAMRLYYFPDEFTVMTFPVAVGKRGWSTPKGLTRVVAKHPRPTWTPPASIIREAAKRGRKLRKVYPAGPNNPLGTRALRLGMPGYLIHGTNKPWTIGQRRSHGCIRMRRHDVEDLYDYVSVGTPVRIISQKLPLPELPEIDNESFIADVESEVPVTQSYKKRQYSHRKKRKTTYATQPKVAGYRQPIQFNDTPTQSNTGNHLSTFETVTTTRTNTNSSYQNITNSDAFSTAE